MHSILSGIGWVLRIIAKGFGWIFYGIGMVLREIYRRTPASTWKTKVIVVCATFALSFATVLFFPTVLDFGTYSDGYVMGTMTNWGGHNFNVAKITEGNLQLGLGGKNWPFSSDTATQKKYAGFDGKAVVIHFHEVMFQLTRWSGNTNIRVIDVTPVDQTKIAADCGHSATGGLKDNFQKGYLVMAEYKGYIFKSYEIGVQHVAFGTDEPLKFSLQGPGFYSCAQEFMTGATSANVLYSEAMVRNYFANDTSEIVSGIQSVTNLH
jgi:hypothetical protein